MKNPLQVKDYYSDDPDEGQESVSGISTTESTAEVDQPARQGANITFDLGDTPDGGQNSTQTPAGNDSGNGKSGHRRHGCRRALAWILTIAIVGLGLTFYLRYFNPYATDARLTGCVLSIEKRGIFFKTYEVEIVTRDALADTSRVYTRERSMTVGSDEVARKLQSLQGTGRPVTVIYERFYGTLPWRGSSTSVITGIVPEP